MHVYGNTASENCLRRSEGSAAEAASWLYSVPYIDPPLQPSVVDC